MLKIILITVAVIVVGIAVYYGRFLFTKKEVREEIPADMKSTSRAVRAGDFVDIDFIHKGSGAAKFIEDASGHKFVRFENLEVTNGPDLYVYLTKNPQPTNDIKSLGDFINLGRLKGNVGDQNYEISQDVEGYNTVVIWCRQFGVLFSYAVMK